MTLKNNVWEIDGYLNTHHPQVVLGYVSLNGLISDAENEIILEGKTPKREPIVFKTKTKQGKVTIEKRHEIVLPEITKDMANKQREKMQFKQKMQDQITIIKHTQGWQCWNCREVETMKKYKDKEYVLNIAFNDAPLNVTQEEKIFICGTCGKKIGLKFKKTSKIMLVETRKID